jgi:hypothetical protein
MPATHSPSRTPLRPADVLDLYFLETRAKLLEIAATLDRLDRATVGATPEDRLASTDPRLTFIQQSLQLLQSANPNRAEQIQRLYSIQP